MRREYLLLCFWSASRLDLPRGCRRLRILVGGPVQSCPVLSDPSWDEMRRGYRGYATRAAVPNISRLLPLLVLSRCLSRHPRASSVLSINPHFVGPTTPVLTLSIPSILHVVLLHRNPFHPTPPPPGSPARLRSHASHIAAFEEALSYNDLLPDTSDPATPHSGRSPRSQTNKSLPQSPSNKTTTSNERELPSELEPPGSAASGARKNLMAGGPLSPNDLDHHHLHRSGSSQTISSGWEKVEKVKAMSDFAPIHQRITSKARDDESERDDGAESGGGGSRRGRRARSRNRLGLGSRSGSAHGGASGWSYQIGRWPLLGFIFLVLFLEFSFYVFIRQIVNSWEWLVSITGGRRKRYLTNRLRTARDWEDWKWAAAEMDDYLEFNEWKQTDEDRNYDYPLVRKVRRSLIHLRKINDVRGIMGVLEICLRNNFAGTEGMRIYSETFIGTKRLVESESGVADFAPASCPSSSTLLFFTLGRHALTLSIRTPPRATQLTPYLIHYPLAANPPPPPKATSMKSRHLSISSYNPTTSLSKKNVASTEQSTKTTALPRSVSPVAQVSVTTTSESSRRSWMPT